MRGWIAAVVAVFVLGLFTVPAHADASGRGDDRGDANRPERVGPEDATTDYPGAKWLAAHKNNYTAANRPSSDPINTIVVHTMQGSYEGTKAWFRNPQAQVTTQYIIRSSDGEITQMVHERDIAWHAGNWDVNTRSIGIEHEGWVQEPKKWYTDAMYKSSAKLVRAICLKYKIPMDRKHIIGHVEVPGADHTDPGKGWDWDKYMKLIKQADTNPIKLNNDTNATAPSSAWKTRHQAGDYGPDYAYAEPVKSSDPYWYTANIPTSGKYEFYVWYPADSKHNKQTPYVINTAGSGEWKTIYVDQTKNGGAWHSIGTFNMDKGKYPAVAVSRWTGGKGLVIADGIKLVSR